MYKLRTQYARFKKLAFIFLIGAAITLGFIAGAAIRPFSNDLKISDANNTAMFKNVAEHTNTYGRAQQAVLGVTASDADKKDTCFQYPTPNNESSRLWCGSTVTKTISVQANSQYITTLLKKLDAVVASEHMHVTIPAGTNIAYDAIVYEASASGPYNSQTCETSVTYFPNGNTPHAVKNPEALHYKLSCRAPSSGIIPGYIYTGRQ